MIENSTSKKNQKHFPLALLRTMLSLLMIIHSITRILIGGVEGFGIFLNNYGFPLGEILAWVITICEIIGSILLVFNTQVRYVSLYFIFQLLLGIFMVHLHEGWFVVGAGRNGVEYSVLLITCFVVIGWNDILKRKIKVIGEK